jgi:3-deoxy-D-manno-octulosonate 8-phosphate phosphatase (KDO 8-P phosphatase)
MIELLVLDVDGTLTDGKIIYSNNNEELKQFCVKDGLAIAYWTKVLKKPIAIITGRESNIVTKRAKELNISHLYQGVHNKSEVLENILNTQNLTWNNVASIGDDLNDLKMLKKSALSFAPQNASDYIKDIVNVITPNCGGDGAVRYMIEYILKYQNQEKEFLAIWE